MAELALVTYPRTIRTDFDKLCAIYSLIEQMRLEHNKVAEIARNNPEKYLKSGKFKVYAKESKQRVKWLLHERNNLIEKIRWANYTLEEWRGINKLSQEEQDAIYIQLFGDRAKLRSQKTRATSLLLNELKAINLDAIDVVPVSNPDPTEDLTTYTEVDPLSHISKTASRVTFTTLSRDEHTYLYKDFGANHFDGDFEHLFKSLIDDNSGGADAAYALANIVGAIDEIYAGDGLFSTWYCVDVSHPRNYLIESDGGTQYSDYTTVEMNRDILYYVEFERVESIGTYGTIYAYICTGNYYDDGGTLIDSTSITLHTSKKDFRYLYAIVSRDANSSNWNTGYNEDIDLQEAAGLSMPVAMHHYRSMREA